MSVDATKIARQNQRDLELIKNKLSKTPATNHPAVSQVFGAPGAVNGESTLSSRGFSYGKMLGLLNGSVSPNQAKIECDISSRIYRAINPQGYISGAGIGNKFMAPLSTSFLDDSIIPGDFRREMKSLVCAGVEGADYEEMKRVRTKQIQNLGYSTKALSWLNELSGGALVAPPEMGELIELLRNKEALVNAGARVVPLPPQGRMKYPRQTSPSNTYWVGESSPITDSTPGTGELILQAKKLAVLVKAPNELIRFASPAVEALIRDDMTKSLALGLDLAGLEGNGGDTQPLGITNWPGINLVTSSNPGPVNTGDQIVAQDVYRMIAAVEESNAEFETWVMRPKTLYTYYRLRSDAVAQGDGAGPFLFNLIREAGDGMQATIAGFPVVKSTQVSQVQQKGTSQPVLTYVLGGMFSDLLIGMFGAIEFAATTQGDTSFVNDQTWVRGILSCDVAPRHPSAFVWMRNLLAQ